MPAVTSGLILVTGASGFIGSHVVRELLANAFKVRAVTRSSSKGEALQRLFPDPSLSFVVVDDVAKDGAFDSALNDVDGVINLATPVDFAYPGPGQELIDEGVHFLTNVLRSTASSSAKRFVHVSTIGAVLGAEGPATVNETAWNDGIIGLAQTLGAGAPGIVKFVASKVATEKALWEFVKTQKPAFDAVAVLPGSAFGTPANLERGKGPIGPFGQLVPFIQPGASDEALKNPFPGFVNVKDVAKALVLSIKTPEAGGERFSVNGQTVFGNDFAIEAAKTAKDVNPGKKGLSEELRKDDVVVDASKVTKVLGLKYTSQDKTLEESVASIRAMLP